ncbi:MAG TPA: NUDIX hydrolase [Azospirillaceae bacterium]|nr:NUDIX hydrolase [Azospirillaceae bacterium]
MSAGPPPDHPPDLPAAGVRPWRRLSSRYSYEDRWLRLRSDRCELPDGRVVDPYHVLEFPDWTAVVALTPADEIVLVREYRHGTGEIVLNLPAGMVESTDESAERAARRELAEETGFGGGHWRHLLTFAANPARQDNRVHAFAARGVERIGHPRFDEAEACETVLMPFAQFRTAAASGEVAIQGLHLAALFAFIAGGGAPG